MAKFAVLGDCHIGVRSNSERFHRLFEEFLSKLFFPYLEANNIKTVYQLGDLFDVRKNISPYSLNESKRYFFNELRDRGIDFITLLGNHDLYWRESLSVNTPEQVLGEYGNIQVINKPTKVDFHGTSIDFIPWICKENYDEVMPYIQKSRSDLCFGHFEIAGFSMYRGMEAKHGLSASMFEKYEMTLSGHYHTKSNQDNITYTGTPYEMTWQDYNDPRGFHVFDTDTRRLDFIPNPYTIYEKFVYDDSKEDPVDRVGDLQFHDMIVKVIVVNKTDQVKFDKFMEKVTKSMPHDLKIVEDFSEFREGDVEEDVRLEDTLTVISKYIDSVDTNMDKDEVKTYMKMLFTEAINVEEA